MRIGVDARTFFQRTGIGRSTRNLLSALASMDSENEYVVFISNHHRVEDFPFSTANTRVVVSGADWMSGPGELRQLASEAIEQHLDMMYFLFQLPEEFPVPFVIKIYDVIPLLFPQWHVPSIVDLFRRQLAASCRAAAAIVTPSFATARDLMAVAGVEKTKISIVPEAIPLTHRENRHPSIPSTGSPFALFVGTLEPRKNVRFLIDLWRRHADEFRNLRLVIAGKKGWDVEASEQVAAGSSGIEYAGYISDEQLSDLYSKARCLVYPSLYEGFGLPVMEAMSAGCPVITSPGGSLAEVAGGAAVIMDTFDEYLWTQSLLRLATDDAFHRSLSEAGLKRAAEFTVTRQVSATLDVLNGILAESCR